jgi:hypothetical protein
VAYDACDDRALWSRPRARIWQCCALIWSWVIFASVLLGINQGLSWAIGAVGGLTLISGMIIAVVMYETLPARRHARGDP